MKRKIEATELLSVDTQLNMSQQKRIKLLSMVHNCTHSPFSPCSASSSTSSRSSFGTFEEEEEDPSFERDEQEFMEMFFGNSQLENAEGEQEPNSSMFMNDDQGDTHASLQFNIDNSQVFKGGTDCDLLQENEPILSPTIHIERMMVQDEDEDEDEDEETLFDDIDVLELATPTIVISPMLLQEMLPIHHDNSL